MKIGGTPDPIVDAEWPTDLEEIRQQFAGALNVYRTMAHHPQLLAAWAPLRRHVVKENTLPPRLQELVVLRTAYHAGSRYEWSHHVARGLAAGLSIK
ncbi:MAG: carboxymuconolactone decarboxylase family protein, partial [Gammaproteobacteria bacterium]|nr:carboxymuconolactone decarboxylase family protein [Gammaproteobacteria bacterium]